VWMRFLEYPSGSLGRKGEPKPVFYESWPLQLAAYQQAARSQTGKHVQQMASVIIEGSKVNATKESVISQLGAAGLSGSLRLRSLIITMIQWMVHPTGMNAGTPKKKAKYRISVRVLPNASRWVNSSPNRIIGLKLPCCRSVHSKNQGIRNRTDEMRNHRRLSVLNRLSRIKPFRQFTCR
jgi:hypothetical protein